MDTSVFVSALKSRDGASRELLKLCLRKRCQPIFGLKLLTEYEILLGRAALFEGSPLSDIERNELFDALLSVAEWVSVFFLWRPNLPDESDNHLIELAVAGGATHLVTHNVRDLRSGELQFPQVKIETPAEFLETWRKSHGDDDDQNS